jgi:glycosyltransferase involved in cell wall biosynthesis
MHMRVLNRSLPENVSMPSMPSPALPDFRRILIVTDAWQPQINGVVRTLHHLAANLTASGRDVSFLTSDEMFTVPMPSYPDIRLALTTPAEIARRIDSFRPDHIHIATEGPLGILALRYCVAMRRVFTTSYHTRFPEYVRDRAPVPERWLYGALRWFHNAGNGTLVAAPSLANELTRRGFTRIRQWSRGVDTDFFRPDRPNVLDLPRPIFLYVGRVAVEKNLPAFLDLALPGSKVVVGGGPALHALEARYPDVNFLGVATGERLANLYASSDVFVFPSRSDTFGIVLLEALASGLPIAAYDVTGPADVLADGKGGAISHDLRHAAIAALSIDRGEARSKALMYSWQACADVFLSHVRSAHHKT